MKAQLLLAVFAASFSAWAVPLPAADPNITIAVKAVSGGSDTKGKSSTDSRLLVIQIENRSDQEVAGLQVEWEIYGKDIQSRNKKVDAKGTKTVTLPPKGRMEVESDKARFKETEGGSKTTGKGKHKRVQGTPDKGRDYAGYVVKLRLKGKVIAEEATAGLGKN